MDNVFLDTGFAIALACPKDQFHGRALKLANNLRQANTKLVATTAVLLEIGNALARLRFRSAGARMIRAMHADPTIEIVEANAQLFDQACTLYEQRTDKEWGLTDCLSFVVVEQRNIRQALTPDRHFAQAGFHALLRTD